MPKLVGELLHEGQRASQVVRENFQRGILLRRKLLRVQRNGFLRRDVAYRPNQKGLPLPIGHLLHAHAQPLRARAALQPQLHVFYQLARTSSRHEPAQVLPVIGVNGCQ
jgi:hypothetical protein